MEIVKHHSVGLVIFLKDSRIRKYLLLEYLKGHFDLVKGHIDEGDVDALDTAFRELQEETGLVEVKIYDGFFESIKYDYVEDGCLHKKQVDFYLGEVNTDEIVLSEEHKSFVWLPFEEALEKVTFEQGKKVLLKAESFLSQ